MLTEAIVDNYFADRGYSIDYSIAGRGLYQYPQQHRFPSKMYHENKLRGTYRRTDRHNGWIPKLNPLPKALHTG